MTRVLMVYHDIDVADIEADELRRAGYQVDRCAGPIGGDPCPVLNGQPCWQVEEADVLVYDTWEGGHGHPDLVADLRTLHPDKPIVLTSTGPLGEVVEPTGEGLPPVIHAPSRSTLASAVELALAAAAPPGAKSPTTPRREPAFQGPRW